MKKSIKKNYIFKLLYQILLIIVPIVVTPYISRVLLAEGIGKYSFSVSIVTYFTIFASLGFGYYAQREIAKYQDQTEKQSKVFWEIVICRIIPVSISLILYFILLILGIFGNYSSLMLVLSLNIIGVALNIAFFFEGNEEFVKITLLSAIIKILGVISIFVFVNDINDLWIYTLINAIITIVSEIILWPFMLGKVNKFKLNELNPLSHLRGTITLFIPTIATSVYTILDKTLIGLITQSDVHNGYYEQAEKIAKLALTVITCYGAVMIPRNTAELNKGNELKVKNNVYNSFNFVWLVSIPMVMGMIAVSDNMIPWFLGESFIYSSVLLKVLSLLIVFIGVSNILGLQYLIPSKQDKKFTTCITLGAIVNFVLNLILIYYFKSLGAAIATIVAELTVSISMIILVKKQLSIKRIFITLVKPIISGGVMFIILTFIGSYLTPSLINTVILVGVGMIVYCLMLIVLKENLTVSIIEKIKNKILKSV